jgi:hypothetical protein
MRALALVSAAMLFGACAPISTLQSARTLGKGRHEVVAAGSVLWANHFEIIAQSDFTYGERELRSLAFPSPQIGVRWGLTDSLDLEVRGFHTGLLLGTKLQLYADRERGSGFAAAIGLSAGGWLFPFLTGYGSLFGAVQLPLLLGYRSESGIEVVLAPKAMFEVGTYGAWRFNPSTTPGYALSAGGSLGIFFPIHGSLRIGPELSWIRPVLQIDGPKAIPTRLEFAIALTH